MNDEHIRLHCLEIAKEVTAYDSNVPALIAAAQELYDFVIGGEELSYQ